MATKRRRRGKSPYPTTDKNPDREAVKRWTKRIDAATQRYKAWSKRFKTDMLEDYYEGFQWPDAPEGEGMDDHYFLNLFASHIEAKEPSLYFFHPKFTVEVTEGKDDDAASELQERARIREHVLNTVTRSKQVRFRNSTQLALHESNFRFGVIEVGYSADFIDNPRLDKPMLRYDGKGEMEEDGKPVIDTRPKIPVPDTERIFVKRIPARYFRVGVRDANELEDNDWVGYCEWHHLEDVKKSKLYENTADLKATGKPTDPDDPAYLGFSKDEADVNFRDMVLIWKIWDLRTRHRIVLADGNEKFLKNVPFKINPFSVLKAKEKLDRFYPIPPTYNWLPMQDEVNNALDMIRIHRERAVRRYTYNPNEIDPMEAQRLADSGDMAIAASTAQGGNSPFVPVPNAELDSSVVKSFGASKENFTEVSGMSGEWRGVSESETATQANIIDARSRVRETFARNTVGEWLGHIGFLILQTIEEYVSGDFPVRFEVDSTSPNAAAEEAKVRYLWKRMTAEDLGDLAYEVTVEIDELSPVNQQSRREGWERTLAMLTDPKVVWVLSRSETLLRKTLALNNITRDREVREIQRILELAVEQMEQASRQTGEGLAGGGAGMGGGQPGERQIANQLAGQTGMLPQ